MTTVTDHSEEARADVGWIVGASLNVLRIRAPEIAIVGIPLVFLPSMLTVLLPPDQVATFRAVLALPAVGFFGSVSLIAYHAMTGGERVTPLKALSVGLGRYVTFLLINGISTLMALVGLLLLVVPGIFVMVAFMSATTVAAAEGAGSTAALERAWMLSRGSRGRLAALLGIALAAYVVLLLAGARILVAVQTVTGVTSERLVTIGQLTLGPTIASLLAAITTVGSAAAYVNLRSIKEGPIGVADAFA